MAHSSWLWLAPSPRTGSAIARMATLRTVLSSTTTRRLMTSTPRIAQRRGCPVMTCGCMPLPPDSKRNVSVLLRHLRRRSSDTELFRFIMCRGSLRRVVGDPVPDDVDPARDPDALVARHVVEEALQRGEPGGTADDAAVQPHRQHLRRAVQALAVEDVERVAQVREELVAGAEALRGGEPHVGGVERVRHDQV